MGWDMYAVTPCGKELVLPDDINAFPTLREAFSAACLEAITIAETADCMLAYGGLDCSPCAREMERITGRSAYSDWSPDDFKNAWRLFADAKPVDGADPWPFWSARAFVKVCSENELSANASY